MQPRIRLAGTMTKTVAWLMGTNVLLFLLQQVWGGVTFYLALFPGRVFPYFPHTLLSYSFLHASLGHLLFNMLTLYFFGGDLDLFLGRRRFLTLYAGAAVFGGAACAALFPRGHVVVGASGALYGVLTAYALYFPKTEVLLWFLLPVQIRYLVIVWVGISLFYSVFGSTDGVAHLAHLGGAVFAFLYVQKIWRVSGLISDIKYRWKRRKFRRIQ